MFSLLYITLHFIQYSISSIIAYAVILLTFLTWSLDSTSDIRDLLQSGFDLETSSFHLIFLTRAHSRHNLVDYVFTCWITYWYFMKRVSTCSWGHLSGQPVDACGFFEGLLRQSILTSSRFSYILQRHFNISEIKSLIA